MVTVSRELAASPDTVFAVLADGWGYAGWVVGASRIRAVEPTWPSSGSRIHHSVGVWPVLINDSTEVLSVEPGRSIRLRARGWPAGEAEVQVTLHPSADGTRTTVVMAEDATSGPGRLLPGPLRSVALKTRNTETLRRLAFLAERRTRGDTN